MQTILDLNKKVTYRSVKVVYFLILLCFFAVAAVIFYENSVIYPVNNELTRITCAGAFEGVDINKSEYGISPVAESLTIEQKQAIAQGICKSNSSASFEMYSKSSGGYLSNNLIFAASRGVMEEKFRYFYFLSYCLLFLFISVVITEILRRVTYYVMLGTFTPKQ